MMHGMNLVWIICVLICEIANNLCQKSNLFCCFDMYFCRSKMRKVIRGIMKNVCLVIIFVWFLDAFTHANDIGLYPTFESCGVYVPCDTAGDCRVWFRRNGSVSWEESIAPFYDAVEHEYRTSIVRLEESAAYDIKVCLTTASDTLDFVSSFTTWSSEPPVARILNIGSFSERPDGSVVVSGLRGRPDAWIKVVGDEPVQCSGVSDAALEVSDCQYVIFEKLYVRGGRRYGIRTDASVSDVRFVNCNIAKWGRICASQNSKGHFLDKEGKEINNDAGLVIYKSRNVVLERSYIHDPNGNTNPWNGTVELGEYKGTPYVFTHPQGPNAVYVMESRGGIVLRYNDLVGSQTHRYNDPVEAWRNNDVNGGFAHDADIYGNLLAFGQDDGIELDGGQCNVRLYDNRIEQVYCGISTAPNLKGPSYIFNNVIWNLGNSLGKGSCAIKNGGGYEYSRGMQYLFYNTFIHNGGGMMGVGYGNGPQRELFHAYMRNNIFLSLRPDLDSIKEGYCIKDKHRNPLCDFDYDLLGNVCQKDGRGGIVAYEGAEQHAVFGLPEFTDLHAGLLTLSERERSLGKGEVINNFSNTYCRANPSMGALMPDASTLMPMRPLHVEADKYIVELQTAEVATVTLTVGNQETSGYDICMADDMKNWLTVTADSPVMVPDSTITLSFVASPAPYKRNGIVFVRLDNGLSVPITVFADK